MGVCQMTGFARGLNNYLEGLLPIGLFCIGYTGVTHSL